MENIIYMTTGLYYTRINTKTLEQIDVVDCSDNHNNSRIEKSFLMFESHIEFTTKNCNYKPCTESEFNAAFVRVFESLPNKKTYIKKNQFLKW